MYCLSETWHKPSAAGPPAVGRGRRFLGSGCRLFDPICRGPGRHLAALDVGPGGAAGGSRRGLQLDPGGDHRSAK